MDFRLELAIRDNALWCARVCRAHGIGGRFDPDAWTSARRTPRFYPDAVTLRRDASGASILARIDAGPGASIKDSFSALDLSAEGFAILFDATWLYRAPSAPPTDSGVGWERVETAHDLAAWSAEHGAGSILRRELLGDPGVVILAAHDEDGRRAAGAIATVQDEAVGISNVFAVRTGGGDDAARAAFATATAAIVRRFPDRPIVGYEAGPMLEVALDIGYEAVGPLRVWARLDD